METYKARLQEKVYFDSFSGLIKAVYIGHSISSGDIAIKITAIKNKAYKHNEIVHTTALHVIPRNCYHKTGIFTFSVIPYEFMKG